MMHSYKLKMLTACNEPVTVLYSTDAQYANLVYTRLVARHDSEFIFEVYRDNICQKSSFGKKRAIA